LAIPAPYVIGTVNVARTKVEDHYRSLGFNEVEVEVRPDIAADDTVAVTFTVVEGAQQVLQEVELTGLEVTSGHVLTEALRFELGKPVNLDEWALARKRLYDTNVFRLVDIQPVPDGAPVNGVQQVKARVTVEEYPEWSFRYGFQLEGERHLEIDEFTTARNAGVVAELKNPNMFGRALSSGMSGSYERDRQDATVFLATSRLFGWRGARSTLYGYYNRDNLRDDAGEEVLAVTSTQGVSADQRWRIPGGLQLVYGYRFERNHTFDPEPGNDPFPLDFVANIAKLSSAIIFDRRDDPLAARKGTFSSISFDNSALWLGSDVENRKLLTQQFLFVPLGRLVLASRAVVGVAFGRDELLPSDRFRGGGATSVRGYAEDSLGPRRRADGFPLGGDRLMILNQEARFPIYRIANPVALNGVAFIDAGNVFGRDEGWGALKVGYGFGLRLDTPFGILRGDVGFPQDDVAATPKKARYYFGFGHVF
jgi:outer membrane protein assembly factor BamA